MNNRSKLVYLGILLNFKNNVYQDNIDQLKIDLILLRNLLKLSQNQNNEKMQKLEKNLTKRLVLS